MQAGWVGSPDCFNTFGLLGAESSATTSHLGSPLPVLVAFQPGGGAPVLSSSKLTVSAKPRLVARPAVRRDATMVFILMVSALSRLPCNTYYIMVTLLQMKIATWLLLLYALPTKRTSARVNLWRKLKKFGAIQLKTSAYVLPDNPVQYERFQWLASQIQDASGDATLIRVAQIEGMANEQIVQLFNGARTAEYSELAGACRQTLASHKKGSDTELPAELEKHQRRFNEIKEIDYFGSPAAHDVQMLLQRLEKLLSPKKTGVSAAKLDPGKFVGKK